MPRSRGGGEFHHLVNRYPGFETTEVRMLCQVMLIDYWRVCCLSDGSSTSQMQPRPTRQRTAVVAASSLECLSHPRDVSVLVTVQSTQAAHQLMLLLPSLQPSCEFVSRDLCDDIFLSPSPSLPSPTHPHIFQSR